MARPDLIDSALIAGLARHRQGSFFKQAAKYGHRPQGLARLLPEPIDGSDDEIESPAIDGMAAAYNKVMNYKGELVVFNKGCFAGSINSGKNIKLCADHDLDCVLADKHSGFSVYETDEGVTFRLKVMQSKNPMAAMGVVASENRRCVSIQCDIESSEVHKCGGKDVRFITKASLNECSLVKLGLNVPSFAFIVDGNKYPAPTATGRSPVFAQHQAAYLAKRTGTSARTDTGDDFTSAQWQALGARLDVLEEQLGIMSQERYDALHREYIASILRGEHDEQYMRLKPMRRMAGNE